VLAQSVGTVDRHGTGNPDQLTGFNVQDLGILIIQDGFVVFHAGPLRKI